MFLNLYARHSGGNPFVDLLGMAVVHAVNYGTCSPPARDQRGEGRKTAMAMVDLRAILALTSFYSAVVRQPKHHKNRFLYHRLYLIQ